MGGEMWRLRFTKLLLGALVLVAVVIVTNAQDAKLSDDSIKASRIQRDLDGVTTVLLVSARPGKSVPPVGLLTKTARTFVQDGASTEYATQVLGTTLDNGRLYARILSTSSRVFYDKDPSPDASSPYIVYPSRAPQNDWQFALAFDGSSGKSTKNSGIPDKRYEEEEFNLKARTSEVASKSTTDLPPALDELLERENDVFSKRELIADTNKFKPAKVRPADNLPTYTVKPDYASERLHTFEEEQPKSFRPRIPKIFRPQPKVIPKKSDVKPLETVTYHGFADFTTTVGDTVIVFSPSTPPAPAGRPATTIKGDATLRPGDGTAKAITPTDVVIGHKKTVTPSLENHSEVEIHTDVRESRPEVEGTPDDPLLDAINRGHIGGLQPSVLTEPDVESKVEATTPLLLKPTLKPTGLLKTIDSTTEYDGTTTHYKSLIYGTYIGTNYAQIIDTSSNVYFFPSDATVSYDTDDTTVEYTTEETEVTIPEEETTLQLTERTTQKIATTTEEMTPEMNELTTPFRDTTDNVLTTLREILEASYKVPDTTEPISQAVSTTENELVNDILLGDPQGRSIQGGFKKNGLVTSDKDKKVQNVNSVISEEKDVTPSIATKILPSTIYKTFTYFTTFFIPGENDMSTMSIKSREVISSEVSYLTEFILPSATVKPNLQTNLVQVTSKIEAVTTPRIETTSDESNDKNEEEEETTKKDEEIELIIKTLYTTYTYLTTFFQEQTSSVSIREVVKSNTITQTVGPNGVSDISGLFDREESVLVAPTKMLENSSPSVTLTPQQEKDSSVGSSEIPEIKETTDGSIHTVGNQETTVLESTTESMTVEDESDESDDPVTILEPSPTPSMATEAAKDVVKTYYTTYTYFTTIYVDDETETETRTEVYTNVVTGAIQPTAVIPIPVQTEMPETPKPEVAGNPAVPADILAYLEALQKKKSQEEALELARKVQEEANKEETTERLPETTITEGTTELITEVPTTLLEQEVTEKMITSNFESNSQVTPNPLMDGEVLETMVTDVISSSSSGGGTVLDITEDKNTVPEDQEISETNNHEVEPAPTLLLQTSYTTFTYFTTMYKGDDSNIVSRLETVTNIVTETIRPSAVMPSPTSTLPVTYFTTFTYWTTFYKGGDTITTSREETVSNVLTPGIDPTPTTEPSVAKAIATASPVIEDGVIEKKSKAVAENEVAAPAIVDSEKSTTEENTSKESTTSIDIVTTPENKVNVNSSAISPDPTTFYTTFTYFTTSYLGNETILNSRLETVTNVANIGDKEIQATGRAIGSAAPGIQVIATQEKDHVASTLVSTKVENVPKTGLLSTVRTSQVTDGITTHFETDIYGTYIDGLYAKIVESSTRLETPSLPSVTTPVLPTGVLSLNRGSIIDADEITTVFFTTKQIGTLIDGLYAKVIESTSSVKVDEEKKSTIPPASGHRTGLVRLIQGFIEANDTTTFYQSKVIGTSIDGRYAQIIESTSSWLTATPSATLNIAPTSTLAPNPATGVPEISPSPAVIQSSISEDPTTESPEHEGDRANGEEDEDGDEDGQSSKKKSRLTFSTKKRTFTPVFRPFISRNRPTFNPIRKGAQGATTVTRADITPTVTATLAGKGNRFSSSRGRVSSPIGPYSSTLAPGGSKRFSGRRGSSSAFPASSSAFPSGSSRGRGSSRISPSSVFPGARRGPSSIRGSSARPGPRGSSSIFPGASSRYRPGIRPSATSFRGQSSAKQDDQDEDANDFTTTTLVTEETPYTEEEDGETVTAPLQTTTESPRRSTNPLLRLRRPLNSGNSLARLSTTPRPFSTTTRRPSNIPRPNISSAPNRLFGNRPINRPNIPISTRPRPNSGSLFPPRGLYNRKPETTEQPIEDESEGEFDEDEENFDEESLDEIVDNDYEGSENEEITTTPEAGNRRSGKAIGSVVQIRPFSGLVRPRRVRRQTSQLRSLTNRFRRPGQSNVPKAEKRADTEVTSSKEETSEKPASKLTSRYSTRGRTLSSSRTNYNSNKTPEQTEAPPSTRQSKPRTRSKSTSGSRSSSSRVKPSPSSTNSGRQFTLREKDSSSSRPSYKRPSSSGSRNRPSNKVDSSSRPRPPRIRTSTKSQTEAPANSRRVSPQRSSSRSSQNRNTGRRATSQRTKQNSYVETKETPFLETNFDGTITVTHYVPTEVTIPVVNNGITEQRNIITAQPSRQVLGPDQYSTVVGGDGRPLVVIVSELTGTNSLGQSEVTRFLLHETPTTAVSHTLATLGGRRASQSVIVPSTIYSVENIVSTIQPSVPTGNAPLANILLSQLLLGQLGQQNPLLGGAQGQASPTTQYNTRTTTYVTTITNHQSTVVPLTFRGKEILTTLIDSSVNVVTATEFITDTIVVTPTAALPGPNLNSLLLLLQPQQQQQPQPNVFDPLFAAAPLLTQSNTLPGEVERRHQPVDSDYRPASSEDSEEVYEETERPPRSGGRRKNHRSNQKKQDYPVVESEASSVVTLYVSGKRPGEFSTVLSTVRIGEDASASRRRRDTYTVVQPSKAPSLHAGPEAVTILAGSEESFNTHTPTQSLESVVGNFQDTHDGNDPKTLTTRVGDLKSTNNNRYHFNLNRRYHVRDSTTPRTVTIPKDVHEDILPMGEFRGEMEGNISTKSRRRVRVRVPVVRGRSDRQRKLTVVRRRPIVDENERQAGTRMAKRIVVTRVRPLGPVNAVHSDDGEQLNGRRRVTITRRRKIQPTPMVKVSDNPRVTRKKLVKVRPIVDSTPSVSIITTGFYAAPSPNENEDLVTDEPNDAVTSEEQVIVTPGLEDTPKAIDSAPEGIPNESAMTSELELKLPKEASKQEEPVILTENFFLPPSDDAEEYDEEYVEHQMVTLDSERDGKKLFIGSLEAVGGNNVVAVNDDNSFEMNEEALPENPEDSEVPKSSSDSSVKFDESKNNSGFDVEASKASDSEVIKSPNFDTSDHSSKEVLDSDKTPVGSLLPERTDTNDALENPSKLDNSSEKPVISDFVEEVDDSGVPSEEGYNSDASKSIGSEPSSDKPLVIDPTSHSVISPEKSVDSSFISMTPKDSLHSAEIASSSPAFESHDVSTVSPADPVFSDVSDSDVGILNDSNVFSTSQKPETATFVSSSPKFTSHEKSSNTSLGSVKSKDFFSSDNPSSSSPASDTHNVTAVILSHSASEHVSSTKTRTHKYSAHRSTFKKPEKSSYVPIAPKFVPHKKFSRTKLLLVNSEDSDSSPHLETQGVPTAVSLENTLDPTKSSNDLGFTRKPETSFVSPMREDIESGLSDDLYLSLVRPEVPRILPSKPIIDDLKSTQFPDFIAPTPELSTSVEYVETVVTSTRFRTYTYVVTKLNGLETEVTSSTTVKPKVTTLTMTLPVTVTVTPTMVPTPKPVSPVYNPPAAVDEHQSEKEEDEGRRFKLATRVMSNGVEVIVAGPTPALRWENANPQPTLTLSDAVMMLLPQDKPHEFVTKTCTTTFTYLSTFTKDGKTSVSTHQQVVANTATEERHRMPASEEAGVTLEASPTLRTEVFKTTYTYLTLNTDNPDVENALESSVRVISNTVTAPQHYLEVILEPSEAPRPETNTYLSTRLLEKTFTEDGRTRIQTFSDVVTQLIVTESVPPTHPHPTSVATTLTALDNHEEMMTDVVKTYFITYTYYSTFLEKGKTVVHTNVATSSDVVTEKLPTKKTISKSIPVNATPEPIQIFATKTYLTTFTYFTTLLQAGPDGHTQTIVSSRSQIVENVVTESIAPSLLDPGYMSALLTTAHHSDPVNNVVTGSTIIFFDEEDQIDPTTTAKEHKATASVAIENTDSNQEANLPSNQADSISTSNDPSLQSAEQGTSANQETNLTVDSANDPALVKRPTTSQGGGGQDLQVSNLLSLGSLGINGLTALGPVITAMAGLLQGKTTANRRNDSTSATEPQEVSTQRSPIYIPVAEFADGDIETAESQNIAAQLANLNHNYLPETRHKVAAGLSNGIPISPGEVITTNSDVIIGKPGKMGPRPPQTHSKEDEDIGMRPPPLSIPLRPLHEVAEDREIHKDSQGQQSIKVHQVPQVQILSAHQVYEEHLKVPAGHSALGGSNIEAVPKHPQKLHLVQSVLPLRTGANHDIMENDPLLKPPSRPNVEHYADPNANHNEPEWSPEKYRRPWSAKDPLDPPPEWNEDDAKKTLQLEEMDPPPKLRPRPSGEAKRPAWAQKDPLLPDTPILIETSEPKPRPHEPMVHHQLPHVIDRSTGQPLLVNIQPSQVANVVIPQGGTKALIFGDTSEPHISGQYFDDPSPYPEPEHGPGFIGIEHVKDLPQFSNDKDPVDYMVPPSPPINFKPHSQQENPSVHLHSIPLSNSEAHNQFDFERPQGKPELPPLKPETRPDIHLIQHQEAPGVLTGQGHLHTEILVHHRPETVNLRPQQTILSHGNVAHQVPPRREYQKPPRPAEHSPPRRTEVPVPSEIPHQYIFLGKPTDSGIEVTNKVNWKTDKRPTNIPPGLANRPRPPMRPRPPVRPPANFHNHVIYVERPPGHPVRQPQYPGPHRPPLKPQGNFVPPSWLPPKTPFAQEPPKTNVQVQQEIITEAVPVELPQFGHHSQVDLQDRPPHLYQDNLGSEIPPTTESQSIKEEHLPTGAVEYHNPSSNHEVKPEDATYHSQAPSNNPEVQSFGQILPQPGSDPEIWQVNTQTEKTLTPDDSEIGESETVKVQNDIRDKGDHISDEIVNDDDKDVIITDESSFGGSNHTLHIGTPFNSVGLVNTVVAGPPETEQDVTYGQNDQRPFILHQGLPFGHHDKEIAVVQGVPFSTDFYNKRPYETPIVQGKPFGVYNGHVDTNRPYGYNQKDTSPIDYDVIQGSPFGYHSNQKQPIHHNNGNAGYSPLSTTKPYEQDDTIDLKPPAIVPQFGPDHVRPNRPNDKPHIATRPETRPTMYGRPEILLPTGPGQFDIRPEYSGIQPDYGSEQAVKRPEPNGNRPGYSGGTIIRPDQGQKRPGSHGNNPFDSDFGGVSMSPGHFRPAGGQIQPGKGQVIKEEVHIQPEWNGNQHIWQTNQTQQGVRPEYRPEHKVQDKQDQAENETVVHTEQNEPDNLGVQENSGISGNRPGSVEQDLVTQVHPEYPNIVMKPRPQIPKPITISSGSVKPDEHPNIQFSLPVEATGEEGDSNTQTERPPSMLVTKDTLKEKQNEETLETAFQTNFASPDSEEDNVGVRGDGFPIRNNNDNNDNNNHLNNDSDREVSDDIQKPRVPSQEMMPPPMRPATINNVNNNDGQQEGLKPPPLPSDVLGLSPPPIDITTTNRPVEDDYPFVTEDTSGLRPPPKYIPLEESLGMITPPAPSVSMVPPSPRPTIVRPFLVDLLSQDMVPPPPVLETSRPLEIATVRPAVAVSGSIQIATAVATSNIPVIHDAESKIPIIHGTVDLPVIIDVPEIQNLPETRKSEHVSIYTVRPFETRPVSRVSVQPTAILTTNLVMPTILRHPQIDHIEPSRSSMIHQKVQPTRLPSTETFNKSSKRPERPVFLQSSKDHSLPSTRIEPTESLVQIVSTEQNNKHQTSVKKEEITYTQKPTTGKSSMVELQDLPKMVTRVDSSISKVTNTMFPKLDHSRVDGTAMKTIKEIVGTVIHEVVKNGATATMEVKPKEVTHYRTLTVTRTETSVLGSPPTTRTLLLTHTMTSTIVETVTETLLRPTSVVATVTSTVLQSVTRIPTSYGDIVDNDSIFVVMSDQKPPAHDAEEVEAEYGEDEVSRDEQDPAGNEVHRVLAGGILGAPIVPVIPAVNQCVPECRATKAEICAEVGGEMRCICRPSFARMFPDRPCKPTYTYTLRIGLDRVGREPVFYEKALNDSSTTAYRRLAGATKEALDRTLMQSDLRDLYRGLNIVGFTPDPTAVEFHVQLSDNANETRLKEVLRKYLVGSNYSLGGTEVYAARDPEQVDAKDFDECSTEEGGPHHDCSPHAACFNLRGSYQCSCREGWADLSNNPAYPGRVCSQAPLGCAGCNNKGHCVTNTNGQEVCECFAWHSGQRCQVNLKVLLIALVTTGAILLGLLAVCVSLACCRKPGRKPRSGDRRAMISGAGGGDTSSEGSVADLAIPHHVPHVLPPPPQMIAPVPPMKKPAKKPSGKPRQPRKPNVPTPVPVVEDQRDRSLTVMIPRAKYRSAPQSPQHYKPVMTTFAADEHKLINYLEGGPHPGNRKQSLSSNKDYKEAELQVVRTPVAPSGALVSAGFQVSATVTRPADAESTLARSCGETTVEPSTKLLRGSDLPGDLGSTLARSCAETTIQAPTKLLRMDLGEAGSTLARSCGETTIQPPVKVAQGRRSNREAGDNRDNASDGHTMAERDLGSTLRLPAQHPPLYNPDRTSDRESNFDSL